MVYIKKSDSHSSTIGRPLKIVLKFIIDRSSGRRSENIPSVRMSDLLNASSITRCSIETETKCNSFSEENEIYDFINQTGTPKTKSKILKMVQEVKRSPSRGSPGKTKKIQIKVKVFEEKEGDPIVFKEKVTVDLSANVLNTKPNQKCNEEFENTYEEIKDAKLTTKQSSVLDAVLHQNENVRDTNKIQSPNDKIKDAKITQCVCEKKMQTFDEEIQKHAMMSQKNKLQAKNIEKSFKEIKAARFPSCAERLRSSQLSNKPTYSCITEKNNFPKLKGLVQKVEYFVPKATDPHDHDATIIHDLVLEKFRPVLNEIFKKPKPTCYYPTVTVENAKQMVDKFDLTSNRPDVKQNKTDEISKHNKETKVYKKEIFEKENQQEITDMQHPEEASKFDESESPMSNPLNTPSRNWLYSTDSGINTSGEMFSDKNEDIMEVLNEREEIEYDEQKFLKEALSGHTNLFGNSSNDDHNNSPPRLLVETDTSIGTDNISTLISATSSDAMSSKRRKLRRPCMNSIESFFKQTASYQDMTYEVSTEHLDKRESLYSTINKLKKNDGRSTCNLYNAGRSVEASYEEVVFDSCEEKTRIQSSAKETIFEEILRQSEINAQARKALQFGRTQKDFMGTVIHLELEKILLTSGIKKEVLKNYINKPEYETVDEVENYGTICIKNLKFVINNKDSYEHREFYLCILKTDNTVQASSIVTPNENRETLFEEQFVFTRVTYDFQIDIVLYCLKVRNVKPSTSHWLKTPHKLLNQNNYSTFNLSGETNVSINNIGNKLFMLQKGSYEKSVLQKLQAHISCKVHINTCLRGFLTIGTERGGCPLWNRRWCVLEGFILKYFNYPSDEHLGRPVGVINLSYCANLTIDAANVSVCPRNRTLLVKIVKYDVTTLYFLCADNKSDYELWKKQLNVVLDILSNWRLR